jgi:hypothetical protein
VDAEVAAAKDLWIFVRFALVFAYLFAMVGVYLFRLTASPFPLVLGVFFLWRLFAFRQEQ